MQVYYALSQQTAFVGSFLHFPHALLNEWILGRIGAEMVPAINYLEKTCLWFSNATLLVRTIALTKLKINSVHRSLSLSLSLYIYIYIYIYIV